MDTWRDFALMAQVVNIKFDQFPELAQLLKESKGFIVEDVTKRLGGNSLFWGTALINGKWIGYNALGKILMTLRDNIDFMPDYVIKILEFKKDFE